MFLSCLSFCPPLWNFNLANNFWTVSARALIFHMSIVSGKTFSGLPLFLTMWAWPWSLTYFLKTLTLLVFEKWMLGLWYFTWVFVVTDPFHGNHQFWSCDLDLGVWPTFRYFNLINNIWIASTRALIINTSIPWDKISLLVLNLLTLTFDQSLHNRIGLKSITNNMCEIDISGLYLETRSSN